jgi:pimeloyl-ACP methyl ester carboxylesterase
VVVLAATAHPSQGDKLFFSLTEELKDAKDFVGVLAAGIVTAPNAQAPMGVEQDWGEEELRRQEVDKQLRIELGEPRFSCSVWLIGPPAAESKGTLFLLPGICSFKECMAGRARRYAKEGYRCVLPDFRGQGRSGGAYMTYGASEAKDLRELLDILLERGEVQGPLGVYGMSYGAACGIQFAGIDPRVRAVVARSSFASMRAVVPEYAHLLLPFLRPMLTDAVIRQAVDRAGNLAGFDPDQADTVAAIRRTKAQVLLIHGEKDRNIPIVQAEQLNAAAPDHSRLVRVAEGDHDRGFGKIEGQEVLLWFGTHLAGPGH